MDAKDPKIEIMKMLWAKREDGRWGIHDMKALTLEPREKTEDDFFAIAGKMDLLTSSPPKNIHAAFSSFGTADFLIKQSIVPVVAFLPDQRIVRCIGTGFIISCTGYLATATHVLLDPVEGGYGKIARSGNTMLFSDEFQMGVMIPISPAYGRKGFRFFPFEWSWYWGEWRSSPLVHEGDKFETLTDIAICKIPEMPDGVAHQPLNLSLNRFSKGEKAYAIGYANMKDIPINIKDGNLSLEAFEDEIFLSVGEVLETFPENHTKKEVPTAGPCFDFSARIPGKMSGGPIFGAQGAVVRGVVSRSYSGEKHAYGSMLGPVMHLPMKDDQTLKSMMELGNEGIGKVQGAGL